jgi:uncharacterized membrane protein YfcA
MKCLRVVVKIKQQLMKVESQLKEDPPHRLLGVPLMIGGFLLVLLGVLMLVFPGPGILAIVFGATGIVFGFRLITGQYEADFDE